MPTIELFLEDLILKDQLFEHWQNRFQNWFDFLQPDNVKNDCEVTLRLTDDEEIKRLNNQFRNQNKSTDVLSFASLENESFNHLMNEPIYLGDIIISVETAKRQALENNHSLNKELTWLAVHGFLHLLGWDHLDEQSTFEMLQLQSKLLELIAE